MTRPESNTMPFKIACLCGAASALLTATLLFAGTIEALLTLIGLITSVSVGMLASSVSTS